MSEPTRQVTVQKEQRCPLCLEHASGESLTVCPRCATVYHSGCVEELAGGRCATEGCGPKASAAPTAVAASLPGVSSTPLATTLVAPHLLHRLRGLERSVLHLEPSYRGLLIAWVFALCTVLIVAFLTAVDAHIGLVLALGGMFGGISCLSFLSGFVHRSQGMRLRVDRAAGTVDYFREGESLEFKLSEVIAIQFARGETYRSSDPNGMTHEWTAVQLALVLAGAKRKLLLTSAEWDDLYRIAHDLSAWLEVPLLDHSEVLEDGS